MSEERQELYCHGCGNYVQFKIDMELDGNHLLNCPECGHGHCRVVEKGKITGNRWASRNGFTYNISNLYVTTTATSTYDLYSMDSTDAMADSTDTFLYGSWMNTGGIG